MPTKDFNPNEHLSCPKCNFEVIYASGRKVAYIFKNGTIDQDTMTKDEEWIDGESVECNHVDCDWKMTERLLIR